MSRLLVAALNVGALAIKAEIDKINKVCKKFEGRDVVIPESVDYPLKKFIGRKGRLRYPQFNSRDGCMHAVVDLYYLDGSGRVTSYPETRYYVNITDDWF